MSKKTFHKKGPVEELKVWALSSNPSTAKKKKKKKSTGTKLPSKSPSLSTPTIPRDPAALSH
jgi:hypothetical protein